MNKLVKILLIIVAVLAVLFFVFQKMTKSHSPEATSEITDGDLTVSVFYCQPSVKGRTIFGDLVPYGEVWRTGANEASTISFSNDALVSGQSIAAGTYSLTTVPNQNEWDIIFNSEIPGWGVEISSGKPAVSPETEVLKVTVPSSQTSESTEMLTIDFTDVDSAGVNMNIKWDKTLVQVPIN